MKQMDDFKPSADEQPQLKAMKQKLEEAIEKARKALETI